MKLIKQSYKILKISGNLEYIEECGRTCYKSEEKITFSSAEKFVSQIIKRGHESVIEHGVLSVRFITNRGVTHELVRHRLASYSQESTRYVNYGGREIEFIMPVWIEQSNLDQFNLFHEACKLSEYYYKQLLSQGWRPEQAREVLPNSLKTEIITTANFREWRHIFKLRCSKAAHPQMRELMLPLLRELKTTIPIVFDDL
jgi:thymidylate synthase (FAD)